MSDAPSRVAVLGAGSWGTALAILLAGNGEQAVLWSRDAGQVAHMARERRNSRYLPDNPFPDTLSVSHDLRACVAGATDLLIAVPSRGFRDVLAHLRPHLHGGGQRLAWATKGLEPGSGRLLHQVVEEVLEQAPESAVISGPTFAREVASGLPTAVTVASASAPFAGHLAARLHSERFRVYVSADLLGVELGGAVKNVLAIAAGIADGLGFGANTRAALITRGLAELMRLGVALGGQRETFMGLAGLGDLVLTCTDDQSRNRRMGLALARGQSPEQAQAQIGQAVEGVDTALEVMRLARESRVEMPICEQVNAVLHEGRSPPEAVRDLLAREDVRGEDV